MRSSTCGALLIAAAAALSGCRGVAFHEKRHLADRVMSFSGDPAETHLYQKVFHAREGSAGGFGTIAGGGCGCY